MIEKDTVLKVIDSEEEYPGEAPPELMKCIREVLALPDPERGVLEIARMSVRQTKECLRKKVQILHGIIPEKSEKEEHRLLRELRSEVAMLVLKYAEQHLNPEEVAKVLMLGGVKVSIAAIMALTQAAERQGLKADDIKNWLDKLGTEEGNSN